MLILPIPPLNTVNPAKNLLHRPDSISPALLLYMSQHDFARIHHDGSGVADLASCAMDRAFVPRG
jgi:hypothetical protein